MTKTRSQIMLCLMGALFVLSACFPIRVTETGKVIDPQRSAPSEVDQLPVIDTADGATELALGPLPQQTLAPGQCGLFLWTRVPDRQLVFFSDVSSQRAHIKLNDSDVTLTRTEARGERALGLYPYQKFSAGDLFVTVNVIVEAREGLTSGAMIPRGTLRLERSGDWEAIIPIAGLIGCQDQKKP